MFFRRHPLLHRLLVGWACVVWVAGASGSQLHELLYTHVMCAEHGVLEHAPDGINASSDEDQGPSIRSADRSSHGEACPFQCIPSSAAVLPAPAAALAYVIEFVEPALIVHTAAPRGPPLAYAPKTSPPVAS